MLKPIKRNIAKQLATTAVGRTTGEKNFFFSCYLYLLLVGGDSSEKKKFVNELTLTVNLVDSSLVKKKIFV